MEEQKKAEIVLLKIIQQKSFTVPEDKCLRAFQIMIDSAGDLMLKSHILLREDIMQGYLYLNNKIP